MPEESKKTYSSPPKINWIWFKIAGLVVLTTTMIAMFSADATQPERIEIVSCDLTSVESQYSYASKGIKLLNQNKANNEAVLRSTFELLLSIQVKDNCLVIVPLSEVEKLKVAIDYDKLDLESVVEVANNKIGLLNKSGYLEPLELIHGNNWSSDEKNVIVENEEVSSCVDENQYLLDEIKKELNSESEKSEYKLRLYVSALIEKNNIPVLLPDRIERDYVVQASQKLSELIGCEFEYETNIGTGFSLDNNVSSSKEFLCGNGDIVSDKLLCPLD